MIEELSRSIQLNVPSDKTPLSVAPHPRAQAPSKSSADHCRPAAPAKTSSVSPGRPKPASTPQPQNVHNVMDLPYLASSLAHDEDPGPITSSKKIRLKKLMGKLNKSLEDFFLKDGPEESSYVDDFSMLKHYNK